MKKFFLSLFLILLGLLAFTTVGVFALSRNPVDDWQGTVQLNIINSDVFVKQGNLDYELIEDSILLEEGDMVKTDENGEAEILFADGTVMRLSTETEITINEAELYSLWQQYVNVSVNKGKIWFRIIKIFDEGSSWEVETPTVVATVRGTAFGVEVLDEENVDLLVAESNVYVVDKFDKYSGQEAVASAGERMKIGRNFDVQKDKMNLENIKDEKSKKWLEKNLKLDKDFHQKVQQKLNTEVLKYLNKKPGTLLYEAQLLAEEIRIGLSDSVNRYHLEEMQRNRRLAETLWLAEKGEEIKLQNLLERGEMEFFPMDRLDKIPQLLIDPEQKVERFFDFKSLDNNVFDLKTLENRIQRTDLNLLPTKDINLDMRKTEIVIFDPEHFDDFDLAVKWMKDHPEILDLLDELSLIAEKIDENDEKAVDAFLHSEKYLQLVDYLHEIPGYNPPYELDENQPQKIETFDTIEPLNNPNEINLLNVGASAAE